jgi:hypothetical protein
MRPHRARIEALEQHIERIERTRVVMYDADTVPADPVERAAYFDGLRPPGVSKCYFAPRNGRNTGS